MLSIKTAIQNLEQTHCHPHTHTHTHAPIRIVIQKLGDFALANPIVGGGVSPFGSELGSQWNNLRENHQNASETHSEMSEMKTSKTPA